MGYRFYFGNFEAYNFQPFIQKLIDLLSDAYKCLPLQSWAHHSPSYSLQTRTPDLQDPEASISSASKQQPDI